MSLTCFGQDSLSIDTRQTNGVDSIHASHTTFSSNTLEDGKVGWVPASAIEVI